MTGWLERPSLRLFGVGCFDGSTATANFVDSPNNRKLIATMRLPPNAWRLGCFNDEDMPDYLIMRDNENRFRAFQKQHSNRPNPHFYITVVPKTLDVLECCLACLPRDLSCSLILNGLDRWEEDFLHRAYPTIPKFVLTTHRGSVLYDRVLDLLVECHDFNFGVIDQDCFVLDREFFSMLQVESNQFAIAPFASRNTRADIVFPRTYFLLLNTNLIHAIRKQYQLSFKRCWTIPERIESKLAALKLGYHNFPHDSLNYFDNFQLIWAMALHDGFKFAEGPPPQQTLAGTQQYRIVHVGAAHSYLTEDFRDEMMLRYENYERNSKLEKEQLRAAAFSYYTHMLLLENTHHRELIDGYGPFFTPFGSSQNVLRTFAAIISPQKVEELNSVIARLGEAKAVRGESRHSG